MLRVAMPFALSLSKGVLRVAMPFVLSLSKGEWPAPRIRSWFDKPVLSTVEGLTTNGEAVVSHIYGSQ